MRKIRERESNVLSLPHPSTTEQATSTNHPRVTDTEREKRGIIAFFLPEKNERTTEQPQGQNAFEPSSQCMQVIGWQRKPKKNEKIEGGKVAGFVAFAAAAGGAASKISSSQIGFCDVPQS